MGRARDEQADFWSKVSGLIAGGVPWVDAFSVAAGSVSEHRVLRAALARVVDGMRSGEAPSDAMSREPAFSDEVVRTIRAGEEMGDLEAKCGHVADLLRQGRFDASGHGADDVVLPDRLLDILAFAADENASHLHLVPDARGGGRVLVRRDGRLEEREALDSEAYEALVDAVRRGGTEAGRRSVEVASHDRAIEVAVAEFADGTGVVIHLVPGPGPDEIALTDADRAALSELAANRRGLILVVGATRAAFAAIAAVIRATLGTSPKVCVLDETDRAMTDALRLAPGRRELRAAADQDPDLLLVPEATDDATVRIAARIAREGVLVVVGIDDENTPAGVSPTAILTPLVLPRLCPSCRHESSADCPDCGGAGRVGGILALGIRIPGDDGPGITTGDAARTLAAAGEVSPADVGGDPAG